MSTMLKVFSNIENQLILNTGYLTIYLPKYYFEDNLAEIISGNIQTIGIFDFSHKKDKESKDEVFYNLLLPVNLLLKFSLYEENILSIRGREPEKYIILGVNAGDIFIDNLNIIQDVDNFKNFLKLLNNAKLPHDIDYDNLFQVYLDALNINGVNLGVPSILLETSLSELVRNPKDISKPFRFIAGSEKNYNKTDYKLTSLKSLASINSTFTALSFEDMNQSIISSIRKNRENIKENISPVEQIIKY